MKQANLKSNKTIAIISNFFAILFIALAFNASAQNTANAQDDKYTKTINDRAAKITSTLNITDSAKFKKVTSIIADDYRSLNVIYTNRDTLVKNIKKENADNKDAIKTKTDAVQQDVDTKVAAQHKLYIAALSKELTPEQVDKVKDGMTYNVLHVTYNAYQSMLPTLTDAQKQQIMDWLVEAREHSMDAESSEKKHAWFGKYKGRINNYLSTAGIDMKKAEADWMSRVKAQQPDKKADN